MSLSHARFGMPQKVLEKSSGVVTEAMQYVRYDSDVTNWDTIHNWTGGLIKYVGNGVSEVKSKGGRYGVTVQIRADDPLWIVQIAPRSRGEFKVVTAETFAAEYVLPQ